MHQKNNQGIA